jgi:DNA-directed RNA polymerase subunit omega
MLKPSYAELMDVLNEKGESEDINSRYTIVIAAAKRARQLIDGDEPMVDNYNSGKPLSTAVQELYEGKIDIVGEGEGTVLDLYKEPEIDVHADIEAELNKADDSEGNDSDIDSDGEDTLKELLEAIESDDEVDETIDFDSDDEE